MHYYKTIITMMDETHAVSCAMPLLLLDDNHLSLILLNFQTVECFRFYYLFTIILFYHYHFSRFIFRRTTRATMTLRAARAAAAADVTRAPCAPPDYAKAILDGCRRRARKDATACARARASRCRIRIRRCFAPPRARAAPARAAARFVAAAPRARRADGGAAMRVASAALCARRAARRAFTRAARAALRVAHAAALRTHIRVRYVQRRRTRPPRL